MSVHGERPSDLVRERTHQERESWDHIYGPDMRSRSVESATPVLPPVTTSRDAQREGGGGPQS